MTLLSAFGFKVWSGENSNPWSKTWVSSTLPIPSDSTVNIALVPPVIPEH